MKPYGIKRKQGWNNDPCQNPKNDVKNHKRERQKCRQIIEEEIYETLRSSRTLPKTGKRKI